MARYQFIVSGTPSELVANAFPELIGAPASDLGGMSLHGEVPDQAAVRSVMARLDDLGLTLLEMRRIPA
jgi:hypothetical protein